MQRLGITALLPPELVYACGAVPVDLNNFVPFSSISPASKLCAWTAIWRDMLLFHAGERERAGGKEPGPESKTGTGKGGTGIDKLAIVAGGDCHNAVVDGEKVAMSGIPTHYFFYPFNGEKERMLEELAGLEEFLGGPEDSVDAEMTMTRIAGLKQKGRQLDDLRMKGRISPRDAFRMLISFSDLRSDPVGFERLVESAILSAGKTENASDSQGNARRGAADAAVGWAENGWVKKETGGPRVALIGVPPVYHDFHDVCASLDLEVVFDELPYEFIRLTGRNMKELAESYRNYTFARSISFRLEFLEKELRRRRIDGVIHYTQFACHHVLEDGIFRDHLDLPMVTIQGDLPGKTPQQAVLRLEAFAERLRG